MLGAPILFRVNRKLLPVTSEKLTPEQSKALAYELLTDEQIVKLKEKLDYDFMLADFGGRFRINVGYFNECIGMTIRVLSDTPSGSQRVACEVLIATNAARNIIRRKDGYLLRSVLTTGKKYGMCTMVKSVGELLDEGLITEDVAKSVLVNYSD